MNDEIHAELMSLHATSSDAFKRLERHYATVGRFFVRGDMSEARRFAAQIPAVEREWEVAQAAFWALDATICTGTVYDVNPDAPEEGTDIRHDGPCALHKVTPSGE